MQSSSSLPGREQEGIIKVKFLIFLLLLAFVIIALGNVSASVWTSGLNNELKLYYNFNSEAEAVTGTYNFVSNGVGLTYNTTSCLIGVCGHFTPGKNVNITSNIFTDLGSGNKTFNFWVNTKEMTIAGGTSWQPFIMQRVVGGASEGKIEAINGTSPFYVPDPFFGSTTSIGNASFGSWHMITFVIGHGATTNASWYFDGTFNQSSTTSSFTDALGSIILGKNLGGATEQFIGSMDEMGWWNRTLSPSEISQLWNDSYGIAYTLDVGNVSLTSPTDGYSSLEEVLFNCSASFTILENISLYINDELNYTFNGPGSILGLELDYNFTLGNYNWTCKARTDANTLLETSTRYFNISNLFVNSQDYNSSTTEGSIESFSVNFTFNSASFTLGNSYLYYNGTAYLGSASGTGNNMILNRNIIVPSVPSLETNKTFYWNISVINSTGTFYFQSSINIQTINKGTELIVGVCSAGFSPSLNFTLYHEVNKTIANASRITYYISYGPSGNNTAHSVNNTIKGVTDFAICINNSQSYYDVGYGEIQYSVPGMSDRRYYIFGGTRLTNTTINIPLYNLETSLSTSFLVTTKSTSLIPYSGYYLGLLRWYPEDNSYITVEMGKTDDDGQTLVRVKTEDVDYRLALYSSSGSLIKLLNPVRFVCQTTPCVYSIFVDINPLDLTTFINIQSSLTWNSNLSRFTFIWNDPSQESQTMTLNVYKDTGTGSTLICSSTSSGYTGILICDVAGYTGTLRAEAIRTASPSTVMAQLIEQIRETFIGAGGGALGLFFGSLIVIFLALAGSFSPVIGVILGIVALIPLYFLGNISLIVFVGIGIIGGIVWHFISRE